MFDTSYSLSVTDFSQQTHNSTQPYAQLALHLHSYCIKVQLLSITKIYTFTEPVTPDVQKIQFISKHK